ncbi:MAG: hypothetical protein ACC628_15295, partial [Pirellulaceae bacterium]
LVAAIVISASGICQTSKGFEKQNQIFQRWWGRDLVLKFDDLPAEGEVPDFRIPYSGYIYPDAAGGTARALRKYDMAFNGGRLRATAHEQWDTTAYQETTYETHRAGLFGLRVQQVAVRRTPYWHGHCNGWASAAIRHPEPKKSVVRNGVTFSPADIKALLAEIYMYREVETVAGESSLVPAAMFHVIVTNWLGRLSHPVAMEGAPGREKWNYPIYKFTSSATKYGSDRVDVKTSITYAHYSRGEHNESPRIARTRFFHYRLKLDDEGEIVSGAHYRDSSRIDMLWVPKRPVPSGHEENKRGNPHIDVDAIVALWRDSVTDEMFAKWTNIDTDDPAIDKNVQLASAEEPAGDNEAATEEESTDEEDESPSDDGEERSAPGEATP